MSLTPQQCQKARDILRWSRARLGAKAMLSEGTVRDFELGRKLTSSKSVVRLKKSLLEAGVTFVGDDVSLGSDSAEEILSLRG